ncbi:hypothetical protein D1AOALGA4SA_6311 [Olavius algarvensis Delta 1 endosymbiont]|nr:hypothetical protein D1AOALGA4SA_6311 [Olavius algarvensis Delta 1 endosymbiont]
MGRVSRSLGAKLERYLWLKDNGLIGKETSKSKYRISNKEC